jgi:hypothetical protein
VAGGRLHVLASYPDGSGASHLRLDETALTRVGDLPLRSVTGTIDSGSGLLVCGAATTGDAPVVCRLDAADVEVMRLVPAGPVAAWPQLVGTDADGRRYVVWATGGLLDASVWLAEVEAHRVEAAINVLGGVGTLAFRTAGTNNAMDVLCYGDALDFARWRPDGHRFERRLQTANDSAATLLGGAVVSPTSSHAFDVWDVESDEHRVLELPEPPERASAQARHLRLAAAPDQADALYWETHLPDDFRMRLEDESTRMVHGFSVRGWLGQLDRQTWRISDVVEVPASSSPPLVTWIDGQLALVDTEAGVIQVRLAERG